ncbi:uncharacterized protein LOC132194579 isoform X6 [Neocloeon triangulifer]|uniref:uncharacterized protein LOC132194579 isoform X6 n=1 Tax=Neocloeon triangulifer TaxID=2078957 RepID=UPI00286F02E8|nr:uncharacterized protein LOC132194579 isoform X6 [Neocloeon triangulifer]
MRRLWLAASLCVLLAVVFGPQVTLAKKAAAEAKPAAAATQTKAAEASKIEEVTAKQLEKILLDKDYVAVFWYARSCHTCDKVLAELEKIDDDTDNFGVDFVKINDKRLAKQYGIKTFPALTYFREKEPILYEGDLMDEDSVLDFLTSLEAMDLPDRIEEVNSKILDKIVEDNNYVAVLFYKPECRKSYKALQELENIDDEADSLGIGFVKIADEELAEEYNLGTLPALVYYRHGIPIIYEHELTREEDVLEWLVQNKSTGDEDDVIEDVTIRSLETLIDSVDNLVVLFYDNDDDESETVLNELEKIDDECDRYGIKFVKIDDDNAAKEFGIDDIPALVYFENEVPNLYDGDLEDENEILEWLVGQLKQDEIEDVTDEMLDRLIKEGKTMLVLFYDNNDKKSQTVLGELEKIDDECDSHGVVFVKIENEDEAAEYGIEKIPALVYFEKMIPTLYEGNLEDEEKVLKWVVKQLESDEIEDVNDEMLDMLISKMPNLAVLFYDKDQKKSQKVLAELENIDDDCDKNGIAFVKIDDDKEAKEYGIDALPALLYFEKKIPHIYDGDLLQENELLEWLVHQKKHSEIPEITNEMMDKLIDTIDFLAVLFYDRDDKQDLRVLNELENIDDDLDKEGIVLVRLDDDKEAKKYGIDHLPALVYFEEEIPAIYEGDLLNEDEVLKWLVEQKTTSSIEEVTDEILKRLIEHHEYVVVYFSGECDEENDDCDEFIEALESIDDELDETGIIFVTTEDIGLAKKNGIKTFPSLVFFRNKDPLLYTGDLEDEDEILTWVTDEETLEIPGRIEEVNVRMLDNILHDNDNVVVFFYTEGDKKDQKIIQELENIDDECEEKDIDFVKTSDEGILKEYSLDKLPTLAFYRSKFRTIYEGDLMNEEAILEWVLGLHGSAHAIIESVDRKTLQTLIHEVDHLAVFFYGPDCKMCNRILEELETIDDDTDKHNIQFVKSTDAKLASEYGIFDFPALVFFDTGVPIQYGGNLMEKGGVLSWIKSQKNDQSIEEIDRDQLLKFISSKDFLAVMFYNDEDYEAHRVLRHLELIDDEAAEYGIKFTKCSDLLMAKKFGFREPPGIVYFRKGKPIKYDGDIDDEEEVLDWLTDPENMELNDHIEKVNRKMFTKIQQSSEYVAVFFYSKDCQQCPRVLAELEHIDDEADGAGINFVKIDDRQMAKDYGVFALPAVLFFKLGVKEPVIYAGDLYDEDKILQWLMTQKDPTGEVIEHYMGDELRHLINTAESMAVYFWNETFCEICKRKKHLHKSKKEAEGAAPDDPNDPASPTAAEETPQDKAPHKRHRDNDQCEQCASILEELENIDDDCEKYGITFVKTEDYKVAQSYGISDFPSLVYFEKSTPSVYEGDLNEEEEVLQWLITQKVEDRIELVTRIMLETMVEEVEYMAVYFYKHNCRPCEEILENLENIDDECDAYGIQMVKIHDSVLAKRYSIKTYPALVYFRNGNPLIFDGDMMVEEDVFQWLIEDENRELADEIEGVNLKMLNRLLDDSPFLAVFYYLEDSEECDDCDEILAELEEIDGDADDYGVDFVKISDPEAFTEHNVVAVPSLIYYRKKTPLVYDGDFHDTDRILGWLTSQDIFELKNEIEEVSRKMLDKLLEENDFVAVYFYEEDSPICEKVLAELETVDQEIDNLDITFVKIADVKYARKWGVTTLPSLVYFRKRFPSIYRGVLTDEADVLDWLKKNRFRSPELSLFMYATIAIALAFVLYTTFLMTVFNKPPPPPTPPHPKQS